MTPLEAEQREAVVLEALTWLRTPHRHRARVKGAGVDCAQLPIAVYLAAGVAPEPVVPPYVQDWHLHRNAELYVAQVEAAGARAIPEAEARPGDLFLWRWGRTFSHGAILVAGSQVVHAYMGVGVTLDDMNQHAELRTRERRAYTFW